MDNIEYKVKIGEFEGPLDLLLSLIEKRKLCINDIALSEVTDGFIEYIKQYEEFPLQNGADFLIVASTLMLIKSLSLLPGINLSPEEKESIEELEGRLKIFNDIKEKSAFIKESFGKNIIFWGGLKRKISESIFVPTQEITIQNLKISAEDLINRLPKKEKIPETKIKKIISLEEAMDKLNQRIQSGIRMKFSDFANSKKASSPEEVRAEKINIVVNFLAMLELFKRGVLRVTQDAHFAEINLESEQTGVPRYNF